MNKLLPLAALALFVFGCASPVGPNPGTRASVTSLAPGQAQLVLKTGVSRALLTDAGFLTLGLRNRETGEARYAAVAQAPDDSYSILLDNITAGDWALSARLYPDSEDPTLLFFANQTQYIAPGSSYTIALRVYEPGTIGGITVTEAGLPSVMEVRNFHTGAPWTGPQNLSVGLPLRLATTLLDAGDHETRDQRVEWTSSNPSVASVDPLGRVSPLKPGSATIGVTSAVDRRLSQSFTVTVDASVVGYWKSLDGTILKIVPSSGPGAAHRISFIRPNSAYQTGPLSTRGGDFYGILLNHQWGQGQLDPGPGYEGTLRDNLNGTLSLTGANLSGTVTFERVVDPKPVTSLVVDVSNPLDLGVAVVPSDATIQTVLWSTNTPGTATIHPLTGVVTPVSSGPVSFIASSLEDPLVHRQVWSTVAQAGLPLATVTGPSVVTEATPLVTFSLQSNLASPTLTQWLLDGVTIASRPDGSMAPLTLNTANLATGSHNVMVKITASGQVYTSLPRAFTVGKAAQVQVSSMHHTLHLKADGTLWGWGGNPSGALGIGSSGTHPTAPVYILSDVAQVAAGGSHSLILKRDGTLWFAGSDTNGQAGNGGATEGDQVTPVQILSGGIKAIAAGNNQSWVLKTDGSLWGAGDDTQGALGLGGAGPVSSFTQAATEVAAVYPSSGDTTFIVKTDGSLWSAGTNAYGQLGDGFTSPRTLFFPTYFPTAPEGSIVSVAPGLSHTVVVTSTGQIWVTGRDDQGQLGLSSSNANQLGFALATTIPGVLKAVSGDDFTALLKGDGTIWASGSNTSGRLGDGSMIDPRDTFSLVEVLRAAPVKDLVASLAGLYLVLADNSLWGNGLNDATTSWLGDGTTITQSVPVPINAGPAPLKVFASLNRSFVIKADGTLWASGENTYGELGDGTTTASPTWINVMPTERFVSVASGPDHTLFLKTDGSVWIVGSDGEQQQGNGAGITANTAPVLLLSGAKAIAAGNRFSLVLGQDGFVQGFGLNSGGQMGTVTSTPNFVIPLGITNGDHAVSIAAGADYGLILRADGTLLSAGVNTGNAYGQAGVAAPEKTSYTAVLTNVLAISAGWQHSLAVRADHTLWAAGWNGEGQLGNGTTVDLDSGYVSVATGVQAAWAGEQHSLILKTGGTLWGTGLANASGTPGTSVPQFLDEALVAASGGTGSFLQRPDGTLWWFGVDAGGNGITGTQGPTATPLRAW